MAATLNEKTNAFIGYIGIKNTKMQTWELSIELMPKENNWGYGSRAIKLFVDWIAKVTD